jgi:hypothetical protein
MLQGGSPGWGHRSCSSVCRGHHSQQGPLYFESISGCQQGCVGYGNKISLFMATNVYSHHGMKGTKLHIFVYQTQTYSWRNIFITWRRIKHQEKEDEHSCIRSIPSYGL